MISLSDLYHVLTAAVPLYVPMVLAYVSVKWWKIFTPDQCSGINHFVALFAVPLVSFHFISSNNPYTMNLHFILADTLQKLIVLTLLSLWSKLSHNKDNTEWVITLFSISTLPNSLIMGIPLLQGMYGPSSASLVVQTVVLQCIIWHTVLLFLFECRRAKTLTMEQFPDNNASVTTSYILIIVWRKLIRNPNTYSSLIGLIWSLISFRWRIEMPEIVASSISILADGGKGMAMFSLGLFMALQPKIISCGKAVAAFAMAVKFIAGPAVMAAASIAVGLRGTQLRIAIVQATLPVGIVAFIFAKEYDVHPDILSTGIIFGMLIALPVTLLYYVLLGL